MPLIWEGKMYDRVDEARQSPQRSEGQREVATYTSWVAGLVTKIVAEFEESLKKYPPRITDALLILFSPAQLIGNPLSG